MRVERILAVGLLLALSGCVTTHTDSSALGAHMPKTSKAEQATDAARVHTELGQRYMANGDLQEALEKLTKALQFDPDYVPAHTVIAVLYERINKLPEAELHYRKAVALDPTKGAPNNNLGAFLCHTGRGSEAIEYFRKAVADPFYQTPDVALTNAGLCQMQISDAKGAEQSFRDALVRNPKNAEALYQLANLLFLSNDAFHARAFLQRREGLGAADAATLKLGHDIESRLGDLDGARTYNQRLQSRFPDSEQARALDNNVSQ
jgi:type IV pilus assembly protein PilF